MRRLELAAAAALAAALAACSPAATPDAPDVPAAAAASATPSPTEAPTAAPAPEWDGERLPEPTGPHAAGHRLYTLVDTAREEIHTGAADDPRELTLDVWYPADAAAGAAPGAYLDERLAEAMGLDEAANASLGHAIEAAPLADTGGPVPVLIFSQGFMAMPTVYAALAQDLASHGYAVAAVSHPYADEVALVGEGEEVAEFPGDAAFLAALDPRDPYGAELYLNWLPDTTFAIQQLSRLNDEDFEGQLDLDRLGFFGHSFGGGAAAELCRILAERCAGAINFDGSHPPRLQELGVAAPYLYVAASRGGTAESSEVRGAYEAAQADAFLAEIDGATHQAFGDGYYLRAAQGNLDDVAAQARYGSVAPERMVEIVRGLSRAFFDIYLRGEAGRSVEEESARYEEVGLEIKQPAG